MRQSGNWWQLRQLGLGLEAIGLGLGNHRGHLGSRATEGPRRGAHLDAVVMQDDALQNPTGACARRENIKKEQPHLTRRQGGVSERRPSDLGAVARAMSRSRELFAEGASLHGGTARASGAGGAGFDVRWHGASVPRPCGHATSSL